MITVSLSSSKDDMRLALNCLLSLDDFQQRGPWMCFRCDSNLLSKSSKQSDVISDISSLLMLEEEKLTAFRIPRLTADHLVQHLKLLSDSRVC
jgi:hypothetical protein